MTFNWKKILPDVYCVVLFAAIAFVYFMGPVSKGYRLEQHDSGANDGINVEINAYRDAHGGETPRWVTSLFGGMPTYQIAPSYDSTKTMSFVEKAYHLWFPDYVWYIFASMLGFYILLRAFDFRQWMAALGAVVWAFSSYFFIIIAAGHIWKVMALAYIPPTIGGMALCYRKKYLLGTIVTAIFATLQIQANHVQMSYYFLTVELLMIVAYLIKETLPSPSLEGGSGISANKETNGQGDNSLPQGRVRGGSAWLKATGCIAFAAILAICLNISNLYHTYEYAKDTMRGKSELVKEGKVEDQTDSGLERSYITAWSYGIDESMTFLIPDVKGGASMPLSMNKTAMKKADSQLDQVGIYGAFTQYWGEQPGTSGPVYLGALVCMLFVMGLLVIPHKNPLKWALLAAGLLTLLLGWGKNFMPFTDFFIDHVPMYSKFRTVASILVVVEFVVPFIALWGLKLWVEKPTKQPLYIATIFTVVICLIYVMAPGLGSDCVSSNDKAAVQQYVGAGYFDEAFGKNILRSLSDMRAAMVSADAWRSIMFILMGFGAMLWYEKKKEDAHAAMWLSVGLLAICLVDMWGVNKRYLNDDMFVEPQGAARIQKSEADKYIIEKSGEGRDYRVLNFTVSTFNDNTTSAFYSSVGGYHAAKLRRYQELIEAHIAPEMSKVYEALRSAPMDTVKMMEQQVPYPIYDLSVVNTDSLFPVINMLNTRWFILGAGEKGEIKMPVENVTAMGNGWFVTNIQWAANANEELDALSKVNLRNTAVVAKADFDFLKTGGEGTVKLTSYEANEAKYEVESDKGGLVVFSEVYYPGWTATIDGQTTEVGRANYVLRAINVPAGKHEVVFTFKPQSVQTTETIAYIALGILVLLIVLAAWRTYRSKPQNS
ncbi:MAG: YfhO family protein [Bacteroidaceae bacterium]|nr:YfhO family protein [Bacteroidaceae bacterium]